jgi:cytochrome b involved in lipid metabolism
LEAVNTKRRKLVIFEKKVLDLSRFIDNHPGGPSTIAKHLGKEIDNVVFNDKFFKHSPEIK